MLRRTVRDVRAVLAAGLIALAAPALAADAPADASEKTAAALLGLAGRRAGLCIHVGCGDPPAGQLAAALARRGGWLVHGLAASRDGADRARRTIERLGLYGQASVDAAPLGRLPYTDGLANLVIVDDLRRAAAGGLRLGEVVRVLCPEGTALLGESSARAGAGGAAMTEVDLKRLVSAGGVGDFEVVRDAGLWARLRKARPASMDDWTHRTHDAGGNCVSDDTAIAPLASLRWLAGPVWPMGTGYQVSNGGMLAAGGRLFSVTINEVSNYARVPQDRNDEWFLTARDAYNGLLLWSRPLGRKRRRDGQEFGNLVVAQPRVVYALLGQDLLAVDAASGTTRRTYRRGVALGGRLALAGGLLVLSQPGTITAFEADSTSIRWEREAASRDLLVAGGGVFYTTSRHEKLARLDLSTGKPAWQVDLAGIEGRKKQLLLAGSGVLVLVWERNWQKGENALAGFSMKTGRQLWREEYASSRATWADTVWHVDGLIWRRDGRNDLVALAPATGKAVRRITMKGGYCGGCVRNIATRRYLVSTRPPNFLDWADGTVHPFRAGRHGCRAGVIVANGLFYSQPHGCKCVRESLRGFLAFAPPGRAPKDAAARIERGPAAAPTPPPAAAPGEANWRTFRHDPRRTGGTPASVPAELKRLWQAKVDDQRPPTGRLAEEWLANPLGPGRITAPTAAGGLVAVALRDAHRVVALDAATGKPAWSFTAGGRVDTPPTFHRGLCLFGCYDGWVYCLRASDGRLVWRLRAAPEDTRIVACGQVESLACVVGGVLVAGDVAYAVAGRSAAADAGLTGWAIEPRTGKVLWSVPLPAASSDLLVSEGGALRLAGGGSGGERFDPATGKALRRIARPGFRWDYGGKIATLWGGPNRVLDRTWHVLSMNDTASHWMRIKQGYGPCQGHLLVASGDLRRVYGFRFKYVHWSKVKDRRTEFGGELVAWEAGKEAWKLDVDETFQVEALALAGEVLFAAGPVDRFRRKPGGRLWAISAADGRRLKEYPLDVPPAADGIAVAAGRLYLATSDGRVLCYGRP